METPVDPKAVAGKPSTADTCLTNAYGVSSEIVPFPCPCRIASPPPDVEPRHRPRSGSAFCAAKRHTTPGGSRQACCQARHQSVRTRSNPAAHAQDGAAPDQHQLARAHGRLELVQGEHWQQRLRFWDSLLRIGIGQTGPHFDWYIDGEQPAILGLPDNAVVAAPQGQLGLGGSYYAANNNHTTVASGFLKYAYVNIHPTHQFAARIGRFEYFDGLEAKAKDPLLQKVIQSRISSSISTGTSTASSRRFSACPTPQSLPLRRASWAWAEPITRPTTITPPLPTVS